MFLKFVVSLAFLQICTGATWPEGLKRCSRTAPDFSECLAGAIESGIRFFHAGYKPFGIPSIDPFYIEELSLEGANGGTNGLRQKFKNVQLIGINNNKIRDLNLDEDKLILSFKSLSPYTHMIGHYELTGQVLIFPINSAGNSNVTLENISTDHHVHFARVQKNGKTYLNVTQWELNLNPEKAHYFFDNLFPGNEEISAQILNAINENALDIFKDVLPSFSRIFSHLHTLIARKIFDRFPENEIILD